jgi:tRNA dimethylallyltransferase
LEIFEYSWSPKSEIAREKEPENPILMLILNREPLLANKLIDDRIEDMVKIWLIEEVEKLLSMWYDESLQSMQWIWYKETVEFLKNKISKSELIEKLKIRTHQFAKRQRTRWRKYIRDSLEKNRNKIEYLIFDVE